jgi:hypothetical protein
VQALLIGNLNKKPIKFHCPSVASGVMNIVIKRVRWWCVIVFTYVVCTSSYVSSKERGLKVQQAK